MGFALLAGRTAPCAGAEMGKIELLDENHYSEQMKEKVEPYLESIVRRGTLRSELYYELFPLKGAEGTIVISFGFTESCVKYHEFIYYMLRAGFQCAIIDHRGHGKSIREGRYPNVIHVKRFDRYTEDLHAFVHEVVLPELGGAGDGLFLFGHSMGGCIASRYIELYPDDFAAAVLNAPMLAINTGSLPAWLAVLACDVFILTGSADKKLFYQGDFNPDEPFEKSCATSRARFEYYHEIRKNNKEYQTTSASYSWARQSVLAGRRACSARETAKVKIPVLLLQAGVDTLVKSESQQKFIARIAHGKLERVPNSKHEIFRSENSVLAGYYERILSFFRNRA